MRKWKVIALMLVLGLVLAPLGAAQSADDLKQEVKQLRHDLQQVLKNQADLRSQNDDLRARVDTPGDNLENMINVVAESVPYVGSGANSTTMSGASRIRHGMAWDRGFDENDAVDDDGTYGSMRFDLGIGMAFDAGVSTMLSFQLYDEYDGNNFGAASGAGFYEAYINFDNVMGNSELSARIGRQEVALGNELIFGDNDWYNGQTHDGSHWTWASADWTMHMMYLKGATEGGVDSQNYNGSATASDYDDDEVYGAYFTLNTIANHVLDLYWVYSNNHNNPDPAASVGSWFHTIGARIAGTIDVGNGLDWSLELATQEGSMDANSGLGEADVDVDGLVIEASVGMGFGEGFGLSLGYYSSEGADASDNDSGFIHLNPDVHGRVGQMDIIPLANCEAWQIGLAWDFSPSWSLGAAIVDAEQEDGGLDYGTEFDLWVSHAYSADATISAGLGILEPDDGLTAGGSDDNAVMFYMQARVTF